MKLINPQLQIDPESWPTAGANVVKNGSPPKSLYFAGADAAGAHCLYGGYPHVSIYFAALPTHPNTTELLVMAPPFANKAQVGAVAYMTNEVASIKHIVVVNSTSGVTEYKIPAPAADISDASGEELIKKTQIVWGAATDAATMLDISESGNLGEPELQTLTLKVEDSAITCVGLIVRWMRDDSTI